MPGLVLRNAWLACKKCVVSAENQKHTISRRLITFYVMSHVGRAKVAFLLLGECKKYLHILVINNMGDVVYVLG